MMNATGFGRAQRGTLALTILAAMAAPAMATDWLEPRSNDMDAGELSAAAQYPIGIGELESITGRLDGGQLGGPGFGDPPGVPDGQDLFAIFIPNPTLFTARTVAFGFEDLDTQLFLFSLGGQGLLSNDNLDPSTLFSRLVPVATDGSFALTTPGIYIIGVAGPGNIPVSSGALPIFSALSPFEVSGPDGPGGALMHDGWLGDPVVGRYQIELTGAQYVPVPGSVAALLLGTALLARRRREA